MVRFGDAEGFELVDLGGSEIHIFIINNKIQMTNDKKIQNPNDKIQKIKNPNDK